MARSTHADLTTAQKAASRRPAVRIRAYDKIADIARLRWQRVYTGAEEENYHASVITTDGSLLRVRILADSPAGLYYQRVANPDADSDYSTWISLGTVGLAGVALSRASSGKVLRVFLSGSIVGVAESSDNGQNFAGAVTAANLAGVTYVAVAQKSDGDAVIIYSDGTLLKAVRRTAGVWQTPVDSGFSMNSITGVSVQWAGDFHIIVTGTDGNDNPFLASAVFGDGGVVSVDTWLDLLSATIAVASDGSNVSFTAPFFVYGNNGWLSAVEQYTGSVAYDQPHLSWFAPSISFQANAWREPEAFDLAAPFGVALAASATHLWLTTNFGVWLAPYTAPATDLSAFVEDVKLDVQPHAGSAIITLDNAGGRFNDLASGDYSVLQVGAQINIETGFETTSGTKYPAPGLYHWLDRFEYHVSGDMSVLVLHLSNVWGLLAAWRARQQLDWSADVQTVAQLLTFVFGRAGVELVTAGTSTIATTLKPAFTINPGQDGASIVRRLLAMIPDLIYPTASFVYLSEPADDDSSDYTFGTDHPILEAVYAAEGMASNRVLVLGTGHADSGFDWDDIENSQDKVRTVIDINLDSAAEVTARAATELRRDQLAPQLGIITTPIVAGMDLFDVATISDAHAAPNPIDYRVQHLRQHYRRAGRRPLYEQRLTLGKV